MTSNTEGPILNPQSSAGYAGVQALYRATKKRNKKIKLDDVKQWLSKQNTYTLHKPIRRKFPRRKSIVVGIDYRWQGDLADMSCMSKYNDQLRYLYCLIDVFSKYAWWSRSKIKREKL